MKKSTQKTCYLCKCEEFEKVKGIVRDNRHLRVYKCKKCSLISLDTSQHITEEFYKIGQMHKGKFNPEKWAENSRPDDERRYKFVKKSIKNKIVVDFGCGAGGFLQFARKSCDKVYGVELEKKQRDYLIAKGFAIRETIGEINEKCDVITMFHVLEHIENPIELLEEFKNKLKSEKSEVIIEVPNADDALISFYKSKAFSHFTWWSCHLYTFNKDNLSTLVQKAGYNINYTKKIQRYGILNHLYWIIKGKPAGHIKFAWAGFSPAEFLYAKILALFNKNDTIIMSISPSKNTEEK